VCACVRGHSHTHTHTDRHTRTHTQTYTLTHTYAPLLTSPATVHGHRCARACVASTSAHASWEACASTLCPAAAEAVAAAVLAGHDAAALCAAAHAGTTNATTAQTHRIRGHIHRESDRDRDHCPHTHTRTSLSLSLSLSLSVLVRHTVPSLSLWVSCADRGPRRESVSACPAMGRRKVPVQPLANKRSSQVHRDALSLSLSVTHRHTGPPSLAHTGIQACNLSLFLSYSCKAHSHTGPLSHTPRR
jgi:hypothetical protein